MRNSQILTVFHVRSCRLDRYNLWRRGENFRSSPSIVGAQPARLGTLRGAIVFLIQSSLVLISIKLGDRSWNLIDRALWLVTGTRMP